MRGLFLTVFFATVVTVSWLTADPAAQAVGYWKSVSDVKGEVGKVTALWKLSLDSKNQLQGTIVWVPNKPADEKYTSKKAEFNGLPVRGTLWMKGLKKSGSDSWNGGSIIDIGGPAGDVYGCEIKVIEGGKKLEMRGYMGISLLGRTQTWIYVDETAALAMIGK